MTCFVGRKTLTQRHLRVNFCSVWSYGTCSAASQLATDSITEPVQCCF